MNRRERRKQQIARQMETHQIQQSRSIAQPQPEGSPEFIPSPVQAEPASTGPRTEQGKAVPSRNAVRHGLCAKKLTGPDLEALNPIRARLDEEWEPQTETEKMLLAQMALSQWRLDRALELELAALDGEIDQAALALALRYRTSAERTFFKSLTELQRLRKSMREDALRQTRCEEEEERAILRQLEAQILKPYSRPPAQFVSQNDPAVPKPHQFVSQSQSLEPRA
jgi:hypothetical protein